MWNNYMLKDKNVENVEKYNFINKYNKIIVYKTVDYSWEKLFYLIFIEK